MSAYVTRSNGFSSDLSSKNRLPPKGKQHTQQSKTRKKTRKSKKIENVRLVSVPPPPLLQDSNNLLEISSTSIPLSARGRHRVATPTTKCRPYTGSNPLLTKANSLSNLATGANKRTHFVSSSHSEIELRSNELLSVSFSSEAHCEYDMNESIDQLTSEIDDILHSVNNDSILTSSPTALTKEELVSNKSAISIDLSTHNVEEEQMVDDNIVAVSFKEENDCSLKRESIEETSAKDRGRAAVQIQRWYREIKNRNSHRTLESLLKIKRKEMKNQMQQTVLNEQQTKKEEKQQRRENKMKAARQAAIETLKQKRDEKRKENERIIKQEMVNIELKGKVKKKQAAKEKQSVVDGNIALIQQNESETQQQENNSNVDDKKIDETDHKVDEFFKAGPRKPTPRTSPSHITPSPSQVHHTSSTMESIFATLKELEEAPPPLPGGLDISVGYLSECNLQKLPTVATTNDSNSKLQSILTYLDEVEKNATTHSVNSNDHIQDVADSEVEVNQQLEAASTVANDVRTTIVTQRMEIENKNKTIDMLQKSLAQQRELTVYHAKEMEKESEKRLDLQKQEYETTIQRHQCFIDQLIDDKKVLSDKCEQLIKELKETNKKHKAKVTAMEDSHATELEKQKQTFAAAEKLRREKWRTEETQRIKEATVKSLEPEIQRIIAKGKTEIQKLKALHEAELLNADDKASKRFLQQTEELRIQHAQEKEMACQHERELARQKYEQLAEQEERSYQQLRKKLYSELQQERDKLNAEMNGHNSAIEKQMKELKETHTIEIMKLKTEHESALNELKEKHALEIRDIQERSKIEKQMWEENYFKKQDAVLMTREREMRERLRRERDIEIENVIQKLETETATAKEESERAAESRIKRIREKYETELKEVEKSERNTLQKFNSMKTQLTDLEGIIIKLRSQLKHKEEVVTEVNEIATRLTKERDQFADVVRQEFNDKLITIEQENRQLKLEMSEMETKHKLELDRLERSKERELAEVHTRVKQALAKKEENQKSLKAQHEAALKRADHLEMLLEQQRKELLKR